MTLAKAAQLEQTTVSKIEKGRVRPEAATLAALARELKVPVQWLAEGVGDSGLRTDGPLGVVRSGRRQFEDASRISKVVGEHFATKSLIDMMDRAFDRSRGHSLSDVSVLKLYLDEAGFFGETRAPDDQVVEMVESWLDALAELRREWKEGTPGATLLDILVRASANHGRQKP